jgi:P4 family phage/plasmid primase-like protien
LSRRPANVVSIQRALFERGDHVELADRLVSTLRAQAHTTFTDGQFYQYSERDGIFSIVEASRLSQIVQSFAGAKVRNAKRPLAIRAADVAGALRLASDQAADSDFFAGARKGTAFVDCFVEVTAERIVQHEHSPEHRARFAYPFGYQPNREPTRLLAFFAEVFRDDADAQQKVELFQEFLGASLLGLATKYQRAIVKIGDGSNGKSVAAKIAEACMPPGSVCAIPPQDMGQEYRRALLSRKLLNVVSELPEADILDSESWKAIVAGDTTTGREIRQAPFSFRPIAGHLYSANRLPGVTDQSHGFWRRILIMAFVRIFAEHEQNPNLADEIIAAETPAIVAWLLRGAQRLMAQGTYTVPQSARDALEKWRQQADQVRAFVDSWCTRLSEGAPVAHGIPAERLYAAYRNWAATNGHKAMASNTFGERMRLLGLGSKSDGSARRHPVELTRSMGDDR